MRCNKNCEVCGGDGVILYIDDEFPCPKLLEDEADYENQLQEDNIQQNA